MKNYFNTLLLASAIIASQACASKSEKNAENASTESSIEAEQAAVLNAERRAALEKDKLERLERRKLALEERAQLENEFIGSTGTKVYYKAEVSPMFVGGDDAMMKYLQDNIQFPEEADKKGLEGTVFVDFIIDNNGRVREAEVTEATSQEVDEAFRAEALRLVNSMPNWTPGSQQGIPVDVKFSIPITFQLN